MKKLVLFIAVVIFTFSAYSQNRTILTLKKVNTDTIAARDTMIYNIGMFKNISNDFYIQNSTNVLGTGRFNGMYALSGTRAIYMGVIINNSGDTIVSQGWQVNSNNRTGFSIKNDTLIFSVKLNGTARTKLELTSLYQYSKCYNYNGSDSTSIDQDSSHIKFRGNLYSYQTDTFFFGTANSIGAGSIIMYNNKGLVPMTDLTDGSITFKDYNGTGTSTVLNTSSLTLKAYISGAYQEQNVLTQSGLFLGNTTTPFTQEVYIKTYKTTDNTNTFVVEGETGNTTVGGNIIIGSVGNDSYLEFQDGGLTNSRLIHRSTLTGNRQWILPDTSGTIALNQQLGNYLPLSGGTMTGDIRMTSGELLISPSLNPATWGGGSVISLEDNQLYMGTFDATAANYADISSNYNFGTAYSNISVSNNGFNAKVEAWSGGASAELYLHGNLNFRSGATYYAIVKTALLSAHRNFEFPNRSGTFALEDLVFWDLSSSVILPKNLGHKLKVTNTPEVASPDSAFCKTPTGEFGMFALVNPAYQTGSIANKTTRLDDINADSLNTDIIYNNNEDSVTIFDDLFVIGTIKSATPKFYAAFADSAETISMTQNVYAHITGNGNNLFTAYRVGNGFTFQNDSVQLPALVGWFRIALSDSYQGTASDEYHTAIFINNTELSNRGERQRSTSNNDSGSSSGFAYYYSDGSQEWVKLMIKNTGDNDDAILLSCDWEIRYDE